MIVLTLHNYTCSVIKKYHHVLYIHVHSLYFTKILNNSHAKTLDCREGST